MLHQTATKGPVLNLRGLPRVSSLGLSDLHQSQLLLSKTPMMTKLILLCGAWTTSDMKIKTLKHLRMPSVHQTARAKESVSESTVSRRSRILVKRRLS